MTAKKAPQPGKLESQYKEIIKYLNTSFEPLPENSSLEQPSPMKVYPTVVTYGAYEPPIMG